MSYTAWPRTIASGPLAGQRFDRSVDYEKALHAHKQANPDEASRRSRAAKQANATRRARTGGKPAPERPPKPSPRRGPVSLAQAEGLVTFVNMAVSIVPPLRADALEPHEARALALAIVETAQTNPWFANIVLKVVRAGDSGRLVTTVGAIVAVRLARHEVIPLPIGALAEFTLVSLAQSQPSPVPADVPEQLDDEETPPVPTETADQAPEPAGDAPPIDLYANGHARPPDQFTPAPAAL